LVSAINKRSQLTIELARLGRQLERLEPSDDQLRDQSSESQNSQQDESKLQGVLGKNQGPIPDSALRGVYREILNGSHVLGRTTRVGYLGPQGTFSHLAASQHFGEHVDYENLRALQGVFEEVARGHVDYGLIPIENSTGGAIIESQLIYSKAEALAQCHQWLTANYPNAQRIAAQSTAASAEIAYLASPADGVVAIGSSKAGELYGLSTLHHGIEDCPNNVTRFLILSRNKTPVTGNDKTSLMFTCTDRPGSLVDILQVFKRNGINLSHIEKRPSRELGTDYSFFVDILGHADDGKTAEILGEVRAHCKNLFVLGSFPVFDEGSRYQPPTTSDEFETTEEIESLIDQVDLQVVDLINQRAQLVVEVGEFKRKSDVPIYAPHREAAVLTKIKNLNQGPLKNRTLEMIYRELMSGSFALEKPLKIAFLGPKGE